MKGVGKMTGVGMTVGGKVHLRYSLVRNADLYRERLICPCGTKKFLLSCIFWLTSISR